MAWPMELLQRHATMLAFVDDFWLMGLTFLIFDPPDVFDEEKPAARSADERALSAPVMSALRASREGNGSIGVIKQSQGSRETSN